MPLPVEVAEPGQAFIDIFVDRFSRGVGGLLLLLMFKISTNDEASRMVRWAAFVAIGLTLPWVLLSLRARKEYVATIRKRLASRQLDLGGARAVEDCEPWRSSSRRRQAVTRVRQPMPSPYSAKPPVTISVRSSKSW
jgi:hypothetical protein